MKVELYKEKFIPVTITLESQEEVDALFAVLNHGKITRAVPVLDMWWEKIEDYKKDYTTHWDALNEILK